MDWLARELRLGARLLARDKAFSLAAALTLAVCIGANTALFSVVHNVLLRPLPVPESDRIVLMANAYPKAGAATPSNSGVPDYYDRLRETSVFEEQALFNHASLSVDQEGTPTRLAALNVTPSFFRLLRVPAALGRTFTDEEGEVGNEKKVVLSDALLAPPVRRRPGSGRPGHPAGRPALHDRRGDAEADPGAGSVGHAVAPAGLHGRAEGRTATGTATTTRTSAGSSRGPPSSRPSPRSTP